MEPPVRLSTISSVDSGHKIGGLVVCRYLVHIDHVPMHMHTTIGGWIPDLCQTTTTTTNLSLRFVRPSAILLPSSVKGLEVYLRSQPQKVVCLQCGLQQQGPRVTDAHPQRS